ncbi:MAG: hypothetical protein AAGI17_09065 [Planctomycetota bacterium]
MHTTRIAVALAMSAGSAVLAQPSFTFFNGFSPDGSIVSARDARVEARVKVDRFNWDMRLESDSFPNAGDNTRGVSNNLSFFQQTFAFSYAFDLGSQEITWSLTTQDGSQTFALTQDVSGFGEADAIEIFTNGSRGFVDIENLTFTNADGSFDMFPNLDVAPGFDTFERFVAASDQNLLASSFDLSGNITFGGFTSNNPNEGVKLTIKIRDAVDSTVPAPAAAAAFGAAGLFGARRRRA